MSAGPRRDATGRMLQRISQKFDFFGAGLRTQSLTVIIPPTFSLELRSMGILRLSANHLSGLGQAGTEFYSFGPQISWAALDLGHVRARILAARARADAQLAAYEKTVLIALEETEDSMVDFGREQARREYLRESVRSAGEAMALARQRYEGGVADFPSCSRCGTHPTGCSSPTRSKRNPDCYQPRGNLQSAGRWVGDRAKA
jgi:hypothetical protein